MKIFGLLGLVVGLLVAAFSFREEIATLQQQLERAQKQPEAVELCDLIDGMYVRSDNENYAFVQGDCDYPVGPQGPYIPVHFADGKIPHNFTIINGVLRSNDTK